MPGQLSGGQQQRVADARAVAGDPLILLADRAHRKPGLQERWERDEACSPSSTRRGSTLIMVTHDPTSRGSPPGRSRSSGRIVEETGTSAGLKARWNDCARVIAGCACGCAGRSPAGRVALGANRGEVPAVIAKPRLLPRTSLRGNLHSEQGRMIMLLFRELNRQGTTIVQVTHRRRTRRTQPHRAAAGRVAGKVTRIIAADDQPDVLEALRLLLKRENIAMVPATSPAGRALCARARGFRRGVDRPETTPATRPAVARRSTLLSRLRAARPDPARRW